MRLNKLEVFGFKSFFDKTVVDFRPGVNGIVGPNGCGKSNLSDAVLWVLGEQSPKNLRGERMEDVIFNGTEHRRPLAVAEVSLTIGNISKELPAPYTPYGEITFCRRLYRSGESEYLINKTPCRLKDIRDLLIDMGAGYRAHTIIEQGRVEDLITASPLQRREIVEEAAGIAKYRIRKAEAIRKLDATEQNLVRVRDIINEITRQRNALDRQARKAEKYQKLHETLKTLELQVAHQEWTEWHQSYTSLTEEESEFHKLTAKLASQLAALDLRHTETKQSLSDKEDILDAANLEVSELEGGIQRLEGKVETIHAQRREWLETLSQTNREICKIEEETSSLGSEKAHLDKEADEIARTLPEKELLLSQNEGKAKALEEDLQLGLDDIDQHKLSLFNLAGRLTTAKNNLVHFLSRKESLLKLKERGRLEQESIVRALEASETSLKQLQVALADSTEKLANTREMHAAISKRVEASEAAIQLKESQFLSLKEALVAAKAESSSRLSFYQGLLDKQEGNENLLLKLGGLQGMVADMMDVPSDYERATEAILETCLKGIVVENHAEIKKGIELLQAAQKGRGIFFPRQPRAFKQGEPGPVSGEGLLGRAIDLIPFRKGYETIAEVLLGRVFFTTDLDAALRLWHDFPGVETWVTLQGEVINRSGSVSGGKWNEKGVLVQKREIQSLSGQVKQLQSEMATLQIESDQAQKDLQSKQSEMKALAETISLLDLEQIKKQNDQKALTGEGLRLRGELQTLHFEQEEYGEEEEALKRKEAVEHQGISVTEGLKAKAEAVLVEKQKQSNDRQLELDGLNEAVVRLRMETSSLKEGALHISEKKNRVSREITALRQRMEDKTSLQNALQDKLALGEKDEGETLLGIRQLSGTLDGLKEHIRKEQEEHAVLLSSMQTLDEESTTLRKRSSHAQAQLQETALKKVEAKMNRQKIEEAISVQYQVEIQSLATSEDPLPIDRSKTEASNLRIKLEEMGPVNMAAIEEYHELDTRYQFLTTQEADLTQSIERLREAIAKINKTTRSLFIDTFHILNQKFGEVFTSFFGGGTAALVLLDEAHPLESGIEMIAQPPGKGSRKITLLSGGEKALTAISLLFASFLIHPTPFCLLDEIDAPLDEENTRRFTTALLKMAHRTQFIVVTHNKLSMEIADVLYGVTMEETGISKLVSVNLSNIPDSNGRSSGLPLTTPEPALK